MIDTKRIHESVDRIQGYLHELEPYTTMDFLVYLDSNEHYRTAERLLQLIVDQAVEINSHLLVESGLPSPVDYKTSFLHLVRIKVLPVDLTESISDSAGLRNLLVHEYAEVEAERVFSSIPQAMKEYTSYCKCVLKFLSKKK